uniref:ATP synthase complex subunit 8 n=1 Tax=Betta smaragdina TaxID=209228 RepID=A0A8B0JP60_BETSM|nr:ATP synthase F0 subunit 8 [Betta smaragdina]
MPQLNRAPWLMVLFLTWFVFLVIFVVKISTHPFPPDPAFESAMMFVLEPWNWPWS